MAPRHSRTYSFYNLFYSQQQALENVHPEIPPDTFRGKIVIVGVAAEGLRDVFVTPFAEGRMPGAEVHANTIDAWRESRALVPLAAWRGALVAIGLAMLVAGTGTIASAWITGGVALLLATGYLWLNLRQFAAGSWWPLAVPLTAMLMAFVADLAWQDFVEGREKRKVKQLFSRYVAKNVYDQLLADPSRAKLGGTRRQMTVLFSDMRGFTAFTEKGKPEDIVAQLNDYFTRMVKVLFEHQGTLDKFVGDMVMALFGAPLDDEDHAEHAVQTALAMVRALDVLNAEWAVVRAAAPGHRHRYQQRRHGGRQHRVRGDHELHRDRRRGEPGCAARVAEQGIRDPDHHQRVHADAAERAV